MNKAGEGVDGMIGVCRCGAWVEAFIFEAPTLFSE